MSQFLSEEIYQQEMQNPHLDEAINEAISEELNLAVKAITSLEASTRPSPSCSSKVAAAKRKCFEQEDDADVFQNPPREIPALPSRGKNLGLARKTIRRPSSSIRSLSPTPSTCSSSSDSEDYWTGAINEEKQRRAEFRQRMDGKMTSIKKKIKNSDDLISRLKGERKSLRVHRETLREQIRLLDEQERSIDKRERSANETKKKYEAIAAKFNEINN